MEAAPIPSLLFVVLVGIAAGLPAYGTVLRILRQRHEPVWTGLGRPRLFMASPSRSVRLQRFLYSPEPSRLGDTQLTAWVRFLRVFTAALLVAVLASIIWIGKSIVTLFASAPA